MFNEDAKLCKHCFTLIHPEATICYQCKQVVKPEKKKEVEEGLEEEAKPVNIVETIAGGVIVLLLIASQGDAKLMPLLCLFLLVAVAVTAFIIKRKTN